jgi:hypothetical protein
MTAEEERYAHLDASTDDLNEAWSILKEIKVAPDNILVGAAFRFALVAYARPYRISRGEGGRYKLSDVFVPSEYRELHERILAARDQVHAHSDLTVKEARLHVATTPGGKFVGVVRNVITGLEELANINEILVIIEQSLSAMYKEVGRLKASLPVNSWDA